MPPFRAGARAPGHAGCGGVTVCALVSRFYQGHWDRSHVSPAQPPHSRFRPRVLFLTGTGLRCAFMPEAKPSRLRLGHDPLTGLCPGPDTELCHPILLCFAED